MRIPILIAVAASFALALSCGPSVEKPAAKTEGGAIVESFGKLPSGEEVHIYTLQNKNGMEARIMTYGGIVVSLKVPDRDGKLADVVLGFDTLDGYLQPEPYFGALIGRYANRIGGAKFTLEGKTYHLAANDGPNSLHGGLKGFDKRNWSVDAASPQSLALSYTSADGEEGYPGKLVANVTYTLTDDNGLRIDYRAVTDKPTVLNLTNHSYFNLKDGGASTVVDHVLTLNADRFTPVGKTLIPTGELRPVEGTPFDFRKPTPIGARIDADNEQLRFAGGYDQNWVLNRDGSGLSPAATVYEPSTGRVMEVLTTQPGIQFYSSNFLDGTLKGKGGTVYQKRSALCLETQHFPDSPNKPEFPTTELKPGETYSQSTLYRFSTR